MRSLDSGARRRLKIAALIFAGVLGVYGLLAPPTFDGYEAETAAVAEGIARNQEARLPLDTELTSIALDGRTGRTGILQPVLMVPFYAAGSAADSIASGGDDYTNRAFLLRLYSAVVTALCAALMFLLVVALGRSEGWGLVLAGLFAFASIAFPYAGTGMEPTGVLVLMLAFLAAVYAARSSNPWLWALVGVTIGLAASTRPSNLVPALGVLVLLWPAVRAAEPGERRRLLGALVLPLALAGISYLAYNARHFDDPFTGAYGSGVEYQLNDVPSAAIGLFLSPGKGLAWYSPLVILGMIGLAAMWRRERFVALAIVACVGLGAAPYLIAFWSDETWGPRYLVPIAWLLLIPIAWWATSRRRRLVVAGVAAVAVWIQLAGVLIDYRVHAFALFTGYTGSEVYGTIVNVPEEEIPYGDDSVRWIPALSPLVFNSEALVAVGARNLGLPEHDANYTPFRGRSGSYDLDDVAVSLWWNGGVPTEGGIPRPSRLWLIGFGLLVAGSAAGLMALGAGRRPEATSA